MTDSSQQVLAMADAGVAALTIAVAVYAAVILAGIGIGVSSLQHGRRDRAKIAAIVVTVLVIAGVVVAILSSIH